MLLLSVLQIPTSTWLDFKDSGLAEIGVDAITVKGGAHVALRSSSSGSTQLQTKKINGDQTGTLFLQDRQKLKISPPSEAYVPFHIKAFKVPLNSVISRNTFSPDFSSFPNYLGFCL